MKTILFIIILSLSFFSHASGCDDYYKYNGRELNESNLIGSTGEASAYHLNDMEVIVIATQPKSDFKFLIGDVKSVESIAVYDDLFGIKYIASGSASANTAGTEVIILYRPSDNTLVYSSNYDDSIEELSGLERIMLNLLLNR